MKTKMTKRNLFPKGKNFKTAASLAATLLFFQPGLFAQPGTAFQSSSYRANTIPISDDYNCGFGWFSLSGNTYGMHNSGFGWNSLVSNTLGDGNTGIGSGALFTNTSGIYNTALGMDADVGASNLTNATAIGYGAIINNSDAIQLGNSNVTEIYAGVGTNATFITGGLQVTGGTPGVGKVLTSDALGVATWQMPAGGGSGWSLTGDAGTVDGTNFIGTTDNVPFNIRVNNKKAGRIDPVLNNSFFGNLAGNMNSTGSLNSAFGDYSLYSNTTGVTNSATGSYALFSNQTGSGNTANGTAALQANSSGGYNTATGSAGLSVNTTGSYNTANGAGALTANTSGGFNTGMGTDAIWSNTTGSYNTAVGYKALFQYNGSYNTALGYNSSTTASYTNATAIGYNAVVNDYNKIRLGAPTVTCVEGPVAYTTSDARFKTDIQETDVKGLEFIKKLRPVVYNFDTRNFEQFLTKNMPDSVRQLYLNADFGPSTAIRQSGFIAQEVEKAAKEVGYDFNGVHKPNNENDYYSLAYGQFVVPLVKGMQEQQKMIEELQQQLAEQKKISETLMKKSENATGLEQPFDSAPGDWAGFSMSQNEPNPFTHETLIKYTLPQQANRAVMNVYDLSGKQVTSFPLTEKGAASITITSEKLAAGIYIYSIVADGKVLDSKKMIVEGK